MCKIRALLLCWESVLYRRTDPKSYNVPFVFHRKVFEYLKHNSIMKVGVFLLLFVVDVEVAQVEFAKAKLTSSPPEGFFSQSIDDSYEKCCRFKSDEKNQAWGGRP